MKDHGVVIYSQRYVYLGGNIKNGCLMIESEVDGGDDFMDSDQYVILSKKETDRLYKVCSQEEFIEQGAKEYYSGLLRFFHENGIEYEVSGY